MILAIVLLGMIGLASAPAVWAETLSDRVAEFPNWQGLPPTQPVAGDLIYPDWFAGEWQVESTLVALNAPLAPEIVTPSFEGNRQYLNQPLYFLVRFGAVKPSVPPDGINSWIRSWSGWLPPIQSKTTATIVADRAFNGLQIAQAYLGVEGVQSVQVDRSDPNRQITTLTAGGKLVAIVTERSTQTLDPKALNPPRFITTELTQQFFQGNRQIYLNTVETTTDYLYDAARETITADQMTAIYLSPQDPNYFRAVNRPVALYRYALKLQKNSERSEH